MSASWALIRFNETGNVYMGCYEGTTDVMIPYICTPEECYDEGLDCYCSIIHCRDLAKDRSYDFPSGVEDLDKCEVYSDYGGGFYWSAVGSETLKMIKNPIEPGCVTALDFDAITDGKPDWVEEFERSINE